MTKQFIILLAFFLGMAEIMDNCTCGAFTMMCPLLMKSHVTSTPSSRLLSSVQRQGQNQSQRDSAPSYQSKSSSPPPSSPCGNNPPINVRRKRMASQPEGRNLNNRADPDLNLDSDPPVSSRTCTQSSPTKEVTGPNHIAFICDGNSRWASLSRNRLETTQTQTRDNGQDQDQGTFLGHSKGGSRCISLIKHLVANRQDVRYVTMYGFSSENWSRSPNEIRDIWRVMEETASSFYNLAIENGIKVKILGNLYDERIPSTLRSIMNKIEVDTSTNASTNTNTKDEPFTLCIAINYGGRNDIINASRKVAELVSRGEMSPEDVNADTFSSFLSTSDIPDPDLVIRTGGEKRISNFLIWDCAYSEFYFTDVLWPDFDEKELDLAVEWYENRERRFGGRQQTTNDSTV